MTQKLAPAERNGTDISAASATFCISASKLKFVSKIEFFLLPGEPICPGVLCWPLGMIAWLHMLEYMIAYDVFYCMLKCVAIDSHAHL